MPGITLSSPSSKSDVLVVGAGPTGVYCALRLASAGLSVTVLEALDALEDAPRAVTHMPTMFAEYKKAGIMDALAKASGKHTGVVAFRRSDDEEKSIVENIPPIPGRPGPVVVAQRDFTLILLGELEKYPGARVEMGHRVTRIEELGEEKGVVVGVRTTSGEEKTFEASYLVGADGGSSFVRKSYGIKYEGVSLPYKLVAADVFYPFEKYGFIGANFMLGAENYGIIADIAEINGETLWRVSAGFPSDMSDEDILKNGLPEKFEAMFPGPKPLNYRISRAAPYKAEQQCIPSYRKGNVFFIGDAAHLANPYSGQLLSCGIFDASSLADVLTSIIQRNASDKLLDAWAFDRRQKYQKVMDPLSQACFNAVRNADVETIASRHPFLKAFKAGPKGGPPPTLATDLSTLDGWVAPSAAQQEAAEAFQNIWSKA